MRALVATKACKPDRYEIMEVPTPTITEPTQVLLRVHAATIDTGETHIVDGKMWLFHTPR
jgi:threonine dehydrogenase-like Zn-dependent dehydrogenase